jgi:hypothetical protein
VGLNHSVSQLGIASGLIVSATQNTVKIDKPVTLQAGKRYQMILQLSDDSLVSKNIVVVGQDVETDTVTVSEPFTVIPQQYDDYCFGEIGKVVKPFRLVGVTKDGDLRCKLSLAEYVEGVYTGDLNYPVIDYTPTATTLFDVSGLSVAEESYRTKDDVNVSQINVTWNLQREQNAECFYVFYTDDNLDWKFWQSTYDMRTVITGVMPGKTYWIKVCVSNGVQQSAGAVQKLTVRGNSDMPPFVTNILVSEIFRDTGNGTVINELKLTCEHNDPLFDHVEVYAISDKPSWTEIKTPWKDLKGTFQSLGNNSGTWKYVNSMADNLYIDHVITGQTYTFKLVSVSKTGRKSDFNQSPTIQHTVKGKTYIPKTPAGFSVYITTKCLWSWDQGEPEVDFWELRTDANAGKTAGLLVRTQVNHVTATPPVRCGNAYLFAHSTSGHYSNACTITYNCVAPAAPQNVNIMDTIQGFVVSTENLPLYGLGIHVHIDIGTGSVIYHSPNNSYNFQGPAGIYDVQVAFFDVFGEGTLSLARQVIVKPYIDPGLIQAESVSLDKMDKAIQDAVKKAQDSVDTGTFNKNIDALAKEKVSHTEFTDQVNKLVQVDNDNKSIIQQTAQQINATITGNKKETDDKISKITSDFTQTADGLSSTISSVSKMVTDNKNAADQSFSDVNTNLSQMKQTADEITSTVNTNKSAQDGVNQSVQSQISQQAGQISSVVSDLKDAHTSIVQNESDIQLRATKDKLISLINACPEAITLKSSLIHIAGDTLIDNNVIVGGMIKAGNINSAHIAANVSITAPTINGGTIIGARFQNPNNTAWIDANGNIHGVNITASTIDAGSIYTAGYQIHACIMMKGAIGHGGKIPLPSGYTQEQCTFGVTAVPGSAKDGKTPNVCTVDYGSWVVTCGYLHQEWHSGGKYGDGYWYDVFDCGTAYYWVTGVK